MKVNIPKREKPHTTPSHTPGNSPANAEKKGASSSLIDSIISRFSGGIKRKHDHICPYCQEPFYNKEVLFRAEEPEKEGEYCAVRDVQLEEHWADCGWKEVTGGFDVRLREHDWGYGFYTQTEVTNGNAEGSIISDVKTCILKPEQIDHYEYQNGIPVAAIDKRDKRTEKAICPKCHCLLPKNFLILKKLIFAIVGIKGSGKTVYLSRFFSKISDTLDTNLGLTIQTTSSSRRFVNAFNIAPESELPDGTPKEYTMPPIFLTLRRQDNNDAYYCVFYDIAGESCKDESLRTKGKYIKDADGITMLISPFQISGLKLPKELENIDRSGEATAAVQNTNAATSTEKRNAATTKVKATVVPTNTVNGELPNEKSAENPAAPQPREIVNIRTVLEALGCFDNFFTKSKLLWWISKKIFHNNEGRLPQLLAISFSMSDMLAGSDLDSRSKDANNEWKKRRATICSPIDYEGEKGYRIKAADNNHTTLLKLTHGTDLLGDAADMFRATHYFAVSALGDKPTRKFEYEGGEPTRSYKTAPANDEGAVRLEESFGWMLYKLGIIRGIEK